MRRALLPKSLPLVSRQLVYYASVMWVRRSEDNIAQIEQRKRRQRLSPVGALAITAFLMFLLLLVDSYKSSVLLTPRPFALAFLTCFLMLYVSHLLVGQYIPFGPRFRSPGASRRTMICPVCQKTHLETDSRSCKCGAQLEPLDHGRWVKDQG
jgi:hypothetical protein